MTPAIKILFLPREPLVFLEETHEVWLPVPSSSWSSLQLLQPEEICLIAHPLESPWDIDDISQFPMCLLWVKSPQPPHQAMSLSMWVPRSGPCSDHCLTPARPSRIITSLLLDTQFSSVSQSCPTLCNPKNRSMPGLPVHHQFPEFTQTHAHRVSDAIQPSHPLSSPSPPAPNPSKHQGLFQWVNSSHEVAKVLEIQLQHQSFWWTPRTDLL